MGHVQIAQWLGSKVGVDSTMDPESWELIHTNENSHCARRWVLAAMCRASAREGGAGAG